MAELKKDTTLTAAEIPVPKCNYGVDPESVTKGDLHGNSKFGGKSRGMA